MKNLSVTRCCNAWVLAFLMIIPSLATPVWAAEQVSGELWMSGATTVNGKTATTGLTVLSGNRIQTGKNGMAVINLGKLGRIKLQPESDLILTFTETTINGNLSTGLAMVNAPESVAVNIKTPCGEFDSARQQIASTTMEVTAAVAPEPAADTKPKDNPKTKSETNATGVTQGQTPGRCARIYAPLPGKAAGVGIFSGLGLPLLIIGGVGLAVIVPVALGLDSSAISGIVIGPPPVTPVRPN